MVPGTLVDSSRLLKALGDETRLRLLHLLSAEELSGTDLIEILNLGQSRVSAHLTLLKEVGLVGDRRLGRKSMYTVKPGPAADLAARVLERHRDCSEFQADLAGLESVLERRRHHDRAYFDRIAAAFGEEALPGRTWEGLARAALMLVPSRRCVDLGIGDGLLTLMLAERAESVCAVDRDDEMLGQLATRAKRAGLDNIETLRAEIEDLPLETGSCDLAVFSQALHHAKEPVKALAEARRILEPGGRVLILDLLAHTQTWVRERLGDVHLGFTEAALRDHLEAAGFQDIAIVRAARDPHPPHFMTLVAVGSVATLADHEDRGASDRTTAVDLASSFSNR
ncbi:putative methyltransferase YcgJ [Planctomycetes bacterium Pla163]|uniref:Putative methyltransferase YcgJ n=1 Tax=Rohdeia mirabilis TaxID=2528008 RepID=A0A518D3F3_9BACT|nr:putative methyltransferase YcgJ [Planctomycetes bacterium Pla163]